MKRALALLCAPLALAACQTTLPVIQAPPAGEYTALSVPDRTFDSEEDVIDFYLARANTAGARIDREIGRADFGEANRIVLVTTDGYADDSVRGEQWRIVLRESGDRFRVIQAGIRYNCARGASPGWSRDLCP